MEQMILGKTGLNVCRTGFGALPIQRVNFDESDTILRMAYDNGINFFDTANMYTDSEEKIGHALSKHREQIIIATKSGGTDKKTVLSHIELSLKRLKTDHIDLIQLHNPEKLPDKNDPDSSYNALIHAKKQGYVRYIGITCHNLDNAITAVKSESYDTLQYPLSAMSSKEELALTDLCKKYNIGLIAMKALCGGLLTNARAAFAFLRQFDNVIPIWGIQKKEELAEIIQYENNPPALDSELKTYIKNLKTELAGNYCRGCGYCLPCPAGIQIPIAARMKYLLRRAVTKEWLTEEWQNKMQLIENCTLCKQCMKRCPYNLNIPNILKNMYQDYKTF